MSALILEEVWEIFVSFDIYTCMLVGWNSYSRE